MDAKQALARWIVGLEEIESHTDGVFSVQSPADLGDRYRKLLERVRAERAKLDDADPREFEAMGLGGWFRSYETAVRKAASHNMQIAPINCKDLGSVQRMAGEIRTDVSQTLHNIRCFLQSLA